MIIAVASGKGGTGKTTVATNLSLSIEGEKQLLDCDVEEPNSHIFIKPEAVEKGTVYVRTPEVDPEKCVLCGKCAEVCAYNAIAVIPSSDTSKGRVMVFEELCHSCGACSYLCPAACINEKPRKIGIVETGSRGALSFAAGTLNIGEAMAPPVIRAVKKKADGNTVIIDAPPGTSCPVITAVKGADFCVLVTEPTPFGLNDLVLAVEVLREMNIPFGVVINRSDLGDGKTAGYCAKEGIPILMEIPFSREIASAYAGGIPAVEAFPEMKKDFADLLARIRKILSERS
ncbi:MAG: P-loop NTPase [Candidatus Omnitrophica bacterium]|nr:P-loop NTPase [Candidatus Omnitrophota bacterium]